MPFEIQFDKKRLEKKYPHRFPTMQSVVEVLEKEKVFDGTCVLNTRTYTPKIVMKVRGKWIAE